MVQHNKTALVTGASRGIGRATALALAETGVHVLVHYGRSAQEAQSVVENIQSKGGRADAIRADLVTPEGASSLAKEARSIVGDRLDILVANAGVSKSATIKDHTIEDFDKLFSTNVRSPFFLVQQILATMRQAAQRHNSFCIDASRVSFVSGRASDGIDSKTCYGGAKSWATIRKFLPPQPLKLDSRLSSVCLRRSQRTATRKSFLLCWPTSCTA